MARQVPHLPSPTEAEVGEKSPEQGQCKKVRTALRDPKPNAILGTRNCKNVPRMQSEHQKTDGGISMDAEGIPIKAATGGNRG